MFDERDIIQRCNRLHLRNFLTAVSDMEAAGRPMRRADAPLNYLAASFLDRRQGPAAVAVAKREAIETWPRMLDHERAGMQSIVDDLLREGLVASDGDELRLTGVGRAMITSLSRLVDGPPAGHQCGGPSS